MKLVHSCIAFAFAFLCVFANAQVVDNTDFVKPANYDATQNAILQQMRSNLKSSVTSEIRYFRIKFHVVTKINGSDGLDISYLPYVMEMLNTAFLPAKIQFVSCGSIDYIRNDTIFILPPGIDTVDWGRESRENLLWDQFDVADALNVFFFKDNSHRGICWGSTISMQNSNALIALPHEMGHTFGLPHTFTSRDSIFMVGSIKDTIIIRENVARSGSCCNCTREGDKFCDTPADPGNPRYSCCNYVGTGTDACGASYTPDVLNIMSYYFCEDAAHQAGTIRSYFSNEQLQFMSIKADQDYSSCRVVPTENKTYSTNTTVTSSGSAVLRNVSVTGGAKLTVSACEVILEKNVEISKGSSFEILK